MDTIETRFKKWAIEENGTVAASWLRESKGVASLAVNNFLTYKLLCFTIRVAAIGCCRVQLRP